MNRTGMGLVVWMIAWAAWAQPEIVNIDHAADVQWWADTGSNYVLQWSSALEPGVWNSFSPMLLGDGMLASRPVATAGCPEKFFRVLAVTNRFCNEAHPAVGFWQGTAFADYYYFRGDGTLTGSVYQWDFSGTWLPTSPTDLVFAIYREEDGGAVHLLKNPILGSVHGTNMDFTVDGEYWPDYAQRQ